MPTPGILESRKMAVGVFLFCCYGAVSSLIAVIRNRAISHDPVVLFGHRFSHDPVSLLAFLYCAFLCGVVTIRSPLKGDKFVFGPVTFVFAIDLLARFASNGFLLFTIRTAAVIAWTLAAVVAFIVLIERRTAAAATSSD